LQRKSIKFAIGKTYNGRLDLDINTFFYLLLYYWL